MAEVRMKWSDTQLSRSVDIDDVFHDIGEFGRGQRRITAWILLYSLYTALHSLQLVFIGMDVKFKCSDDRVEPCSAADGVGGCETFVFMGNATSIVSEWSLVCDSSYLPKLVQSMYMAGLSVGAVLFGQLSDRYGRYKMLYLALGLTITSSALSTSSTGYTFYVTSRCLCGIGVGGMIIVQFVLLTEVVGKSVRTACGVATAGAFSLGIVCLSVIAYFIQEWRSLSLVITLMGFTLLPGYMFIPESPRWLLVHGKQKLAEDVLRFLSKANQTRYPDNVHLKMVTPHRKSSSDNPSLLDLFTNSMIRKWTLVQLFSWFVNSATYYGLSMVGGDLSDNIYLSNLMLGLVELPAYIVLLPLMNRLGRRKPLFGFMLVGGTACLSILILPENDYTLDIRTVLALFGKLGISASFALIYIHSAEMFPTSIRSVAMSLCTLAARIGGVISPFLATLGDYGSNLQFLVFGSLAISAAFLNLTLPETLNQPLPETIDEIVRTQKPSSENLVEMKMMDEQKLALMTQLMAHQEEGNDE